MIDFESWHSVKVPRYQQLAQRVKPIIETALTSENIIYSDIQLRIKDFESFKEKITRKKYSGPENVLDLLGCRIICYVISDIERISNIIKENFHIHDLEDKSRKLGISKVGYRTVHFIVSLTNSRTRLPEYSAFKDLKFEIQLRTILQHAWAEIEHDRNYKFKGNLPNKIKRDFKLLAGDLERCDRDFDRITKEVDQYSDKITFRIKSGDLDIPINSASIREYLSHKFGDIPSFKAQYVFAEASEILDELNAMNIILLKDFDNIIPVDFKKKLKKIRKPRYGISLDRLVRFVLIIHNTDEYFGRAWQGHFYIYNTYDYLVFEKFKVDQESFPGQIESDCSSL